MKKCIYFNCNRKHAARGFCQSHYQWLKLNKGDIEWDDKEKLMELIKYKHIPKISVGKCLVPWCNKKHYGHGFCNRHWQWLRLNKGNINWEQKERLIELVEK